MTTQLEPEYFVNAIFPPGTPGIEGDFVRGFAFPFFVALEMAKSMVKDDGALWVEVLDGKGNVIKNCAQAEVLDPWIEA